MSQELLDMAGGDTYRARAIHQLLTKLADGPDPALREMAKGILEGNLYLRDAAASDIYSTAIAHRFDTFWQHHQSLTDDERQALLADGYRYIEQPEQP
ncbi:hypothetical protein [Actinoplanes sp. URMC 104]|uniref:hypothetical protein n=1 Tax=Actinoplanes sp. URMC 104 TaxID=3423409 RepID=UPI003F19A097